MSSHSVPSDGGGGAKQTTPGKQMTPDVAKQPTQLQQQQQQQAKAAAEKKQEKAKVIVQPVHPPLSTTLPLLHRQSDSPQPPAIIETTLPTIIKTSIPTGLKHQTVPTLSRVLLSKSATPPAAVLASSTASSGAGHPQSTASTTVGAPITVTMGQVRPVYALNPPGTTVPSVIPHTAVVTATAPVSGAPATTVATGVVPSQYIPSIQKLPPNSLQGDAPHTKGTAAPMTQLPPSATTVTHSMLTTGHMPYITGAPVGLQLPHAPHTFAQLPRGSTPQTLGLASGKSGLTTALLTRPGVPQGAVATTTSFPQQPLYYPRHHAPGQVHLLTQRAGSPGVLTAGAIPRAPSPAGALATSQPHAIQESLRLIPHMLPNQGPKPDGSTQAKVELKMVIKKDTSKADAVAKGDGKSDSRPSSRSDADRESKKEGKVEERITGVKLAVAPSIGKMVVGTDGKVESDGARSTAETRVEMRSEVRVDVRPVHRPDMIGPRWSLQGQRPTYIVNKDWPGIPPTASTHAGGVPGHMMTQVVAGVGGMLHPSTTAAAIPHSSTHPIIRASAPPTSSSTVSQPSTTSSGTIPVAKVYPRQQQQQQQPPPHAAGVPRFPVTSTLTPEQTAAYLQMHRNSPGVNVPSPASTIATTLAAAAPVSQAAATPATTEVKMERPPHGFALSYYYHPDHLGYQPAFNMQQFQARHGFNPISTTAIRPPMDGQHRLPLPPGSLGQNSPVAAAVAAAAHAANMGGAPGRPSQLTMMVGADPRRPIGLQGTAEGTIPSYTMAQVPAGAIGLAPGQGLQASITAPGASPRPSILRKRNNDGSSSRKPVMTSAVTSQPGSPGVKVEITRIVTSSSPKPCDSLPSSQNSENSNASEASTDTAPPSVGSGSIRIKQESDTNGLDLTAALAHENSISSLAPSVGSTEEVGPSPRKKPRKQQHIIATEHPMMLDDQSTDDEKETKHKVPFKLHKKEKKEKKNAAKAAAAAAAAAAKANAEAEAMKVVQFFKRPCPRLVDSYRQSWKPAHNHFERYSDVKLKDEKKVGIHEIANQRGILKKTDGWKIHHIAYQFDDLNQMEKDVYDQMKTMKGDLTGMDSKLKESEVDKISELVQGSLQRSQYVMEYLEEAKGTILKMLDHKTKVAGIVKKHANKRHVKKKHSP